MNLRYIFFTGICLIGLVGAPALSAGKKKTAVSRDDLRPIKTVIHDLNAADSVRMKVKKNVYFALMDQTKSNSGVVVYSKGRLRLKMEPPENSLIVMDDRVIWIVTPGIDESKPQVAKIVAKDIKKRSQAPLAVLLSKEQTWDHFKLIKKEDQDEGDRFWLEPKTPEKWPDLRKISLTLSKNGKSLQRLSYQDELENKTEYVFKEILTNEKLSADTFVYSPPPGAEITLYE